MLKKYLILYGIIIAVALLMIATLYYPGGSQHDKSTPGYDWQNNYLCNLFGPQAVNGMANRARFWAIPGMLVLCISFALFFADFSKKIPQQSASKIIRYCGACAMFFAFFAVTPYHNTMITIADILSLVGMFYITVFVFKTKLHLHKIVCCVCLLTLYLSTYIYYSQNLLSLLPIVQKFDLAISMLWVLLLQYFTTAADFQPAANAVMTKNPSA